ncbi:hypothetical protein MSG28_003262 [Choristoneura fumiferana]|uniref:Uncharacterized protein n=1 Tax=Choristoneura fumiferana TaxID=7141 RepID=A0ACC0KDY0_CHOFU|nr:hypothetical protein MSG28_003262 [Choristoneura fumiferana]
MLDKKKLIAIAVLIAALVFRTRLEALFESYKTLLSQNENNVSGLFSPTQLAEYNGVNKEKLYLALLGVVYDVTEGSRHYSRGKDGSRAFITGDFQDESEDRDNVLTLSCDESINLINWKNTLKEKYGSIVVLRRRQGAYIFHCGWAGGRQHDVSACGVQTGQGRHNTARGDYPLSRA